MDFESNEELRNNAINALCSVYGVRYEVVNIRLYSYLRMAAWDTYANRLNLPEVIRNAAIWYNDHGAI